MLCLLRNFLTYQIRSTKSFSNDVFVGVFFFRGRGGDRVTFSYPSLLSSMAEWLCLVASTDAILRRISPRVLFLTRHVAGKEGGRIYG